jgi:protein-S-isoprenylcysteine O-methyltransferase Ste14
MSKRIAFFLYGTVSYLVFFGAFLYLIGFVAGFAVPKSIDGGTPASGPLAFAMNLALVSLFALQHSGMARQAFKRWLTRRVPREMERATYVLATSVSLILLYAFWQPMPAPVWNVTHPVARAALQALGLTGFAIVLAATFMINHFDLFGLRHAWLALKDREYTELGFRTPGLYRFIRHPIQAGFLVAFWATPSMSAGHLLFAASQTLYIWFALRLEERDLLTMFGEKYRVYRARIPMFLPFGK